MVALARRRGPAPRSTRRAAVRGPRRPALEAFRRTGRGGTVHVVVLGPTRRSRPARAHLPARRPRRVHGVVRRPRRPAAQAAQPGAPAAVRTADPKLRARPPARPALGSHPTTLFRSRAATPARRRCAGPSGSGPATTDRSRRPSPACWPASLVRQALPGGVGVVLGDPRGRLFVHRICTALVHSSGSARTPATTAASVRGLVASIGRVPDADLTGYLNRACRGSQRLHARQPSHPDPPPPHIAMTIPDYRRARSHRPASRPAGLPDPRTSPRRRRSGDPFTALRVIHLLARLERGRPVRLDDVVDRLNATHLDWLFTRPVVADALSAPGELDGRLPQRVGDRARGRRRTARRSPSRTPAGSIPGSSARPSASRRLPRARSRLQPARPRDRGGLTCRAPLGHRRGLLRVSRAGPVRLTGAPAVRTASTPRT